MNLTLSLILVICVVIITFISLAFAAIIGVLLFKLKKILGQIEKFSKTVNQLTSNWGKFFSFIFNFVIALESRKKKKKEQEEK